MGLGGWLIAFAIVMIMARVVIDLLVPSGAEGDDYVDMGCDCEDCEGGCSCDCPDCYYIRQRKIVPTDSDDAEVCGCPKCTGDE